MSVERAARGPKPVIRMAVAEALEALFAERSSWPATEVLREVEACLGHAVSYPTMRKVRDELGIRCVAHHARGKLGVKEWLWVMDEEG